MRWRRWQIASVAVGTGGATLFLLGLAIRWPEMAGCGLMVLVAALLAVLVLGGLAWWRYG
jgi:hypothetical protein